MAFIRLIATLMLIPWVLAISSILIVTIIVSGELIGFLSRIKKPQ